MTQDENYRVHEEALIKFFGKCDVHGYDFATFLEVIKEKYLPEPSFLYHLNKLHENARARVKQLAEKEKKNEKDGGTEKNIPID